MSEPRLTRRQVLKATGQAWAAVGLAPFANTLVSMNRVPGKKALRSINVINFLRGVEPRGPMDLFLPLQKQMEVSLQYGLPTTWLLQYDALVSGPFVKFLKTNAPKSHEIGIWFEMNEMHCKTAGVEWRGRPNYEWDHYPDVAFTIGYTPDERIKLADAFMSVFKKVWGYHPQSVASWNLDAMTMAHLVDVYKVDAFAVCRDQIATDGFTIWGAPIAGYYPSKTNCWSPGLTQSTQIDAPVFRMLGQDPVYYYQNGYPFPDGKRHGGPDTMEPVWPSGRSKSFIKNFLKMISDAPTQEFAYAQLGQENNFGWPEMQEAYPLQMKALAELRDTKKVHVETMGETGRRFKKAFKVTPPQAQVMLQDPFGNTDPAEKTLWYQSRFYRANLHFKGDQCYLRDLTVYSDQNPQPFLHEKTTSRDVEQRMPAVLDGYHWSPKPGSGEPLSSGQFLSDNEPIPVIGEPVVREHGTNLTVECVTRDECKLKLTFSETRLEASLYNPNAGTSVKLPLTLKFVWDPSKTAFIRADGNIAHYNWQGFDYAVRASQTIATTEKSWDITGPSGQIHLDLAQGQ